MGKVQREKYPELQKYHFEKWKAKNLHKFKEYNNKWYAGRVKKKEELAGRPRPKVCEICGNSEQQICFDHCHVQLKFRGWLCHNCNRALGMVGDNPEILRKLADYLDEHSQKT